MSGTLSIPVAIAAQPGPTVAAALFDGNWTAIANYVNAREITQDVFANRPVAGVAGRYYFSTDTLTLYADNGAAWVTIASQASITARAAFGTLRVFTDPDEPTQRMRAVVDQAVLVNSVGATKLFQTVDVMADIGSSGVNGLDTGSVAASTGYDYYIVGKDDGTVGAVYSKGLQWKKSVDYADSNRDGTIALRDASARTKVGLRFQMADAGVLHSIELSMLKVTTPAGAIWAELWSVAAGAPSAMITGGRGMLLPITDFDSTTRVRLRFSFPERPAVAAATDYYIVLAGTFTIGASNMTIGIDGSAPTLTSGAVASFDGATWTVDTTKAAALFTANVLTGAESVTMPSGYTWKARASWNITDGSSQLLPMAQQNDTWLHLLNRTVSGASTATQWNEADISAFSPAAWVKAYLNRFGGQQAGAGIVLADPIPLGPGQATASGLFKPFQNGILVGAGIYGLVTEIAGWAGPMLWYAYTSGGFSYQPIGFKLAL